jgi:hypothetical protein
MLGGATAGARGGTAGDAAGGRCTGAGTRSTRGGAMLRSFRTVFFLRFSTMRRSITRTFFLRTILAGPAIFGSDGD